MLPDEYKVSSFQEGLSPQTQLLITNACGGSTADNTVAFVMNVCERLALMSQQCNFITRASGRHDVGGGTEMVIEVSKLAKQMQSMQAMMLSMQSYMTNQGNVSLIQGRDRGGDMSFNGEGCVGFQEKVQAMGYQQRDRGEESEEFLKNKLEALMASAMEFLDEQEEDEERVDLMEELVEEESINEIEEVSKRELESTLATPSRVSRCCMLGLLAAVLATNVVAGHLCWVVPSSASSACSPFSAVAAAAALGHDLLLVFKRRWFLVSIDGAAFTCFRFPRS
ncbi:hypothetical protein LWI29_031268 [Acer saccharum]|uniref:Uncharacterized protein n=1 Tax=Acer saccharum TaxID=4024 RepID=A0AA39VLT0_ACESA|nr:hypothetical protein LWI29_031268 [Acer saccharum]